MDRLTFVETAEGVELAQLAAPRELLSHFRREFKEHPCRRNDFNTRLGWAYRDLDAATYDALQSGLQFQGLEINSPESKSLLEYQLMDISVESHVDEGYGRLGFFLWVLSSKNRRSRPIRFDSRALFRYFSLDGKKQEVRLEPGMVIAFNQNRSHEMLFCGQEIGLALGVAKRCPKKMDSILVLSRRL